MARIAVGSKVKEGPRRGEVVGHRPQGMVDVQFEDVQWVERRPETGLRKGNPKGRIPGQIRSDESSVGVIVQKDPITGFWSVYAYDDLGCTKNVTGDIYRTKAEATASGKHIRKWLSPRPGGGRPSSIDNIARQFRKTHRQECGQLFRNPDVYRKETPEQVIEWWKRPENLPHWRKEIHWDFADWGGFPHLSRGLSEEIEARDRVKAEYYPNFSKQDFARVYWEVTKHALKTCRSDADEALDKAIRSRKERMGECRDSLYSIYYNPAPDLYDPAKEQFRRQQMAIYRTQKAQGLSDKEAWDSSFAIATGVGQKHGWLKPGTQEPTAKGRRGAKKKLKTKDAWVKRQSYELELGRRRKSGKYRVVPQKYGKQIRYYVQPGGRYFLSPEKAEAYAEGGEEGLKMVANPVPRAPISVLVSFERTGAILAGTSRHETEEFIFENIPPGVQRTIDTMKEALAFALRAEKLYRRKGLQNVSVDILDSRGNNLPQSFYMIQKVPEGHSLYSPYRPYPTRENFIGTVAAIATLGDLAYRGAKRKKKKKKGKETENPRFLDERGGMARGSFRLHSAARNASAEARVLGRLKGMYAVKHAQVPDSRKARFVEERRELDRSMEQTDARFKSLLNGVIDKIPGGEYGRRNKAQKEAMGALRGEYNDAYADVFLERDRKRAERKARKAHNPKIIRGVGIAGVGTPHFAQRFGGSDPEYTGPVLSKEWVVQEGDDKATEVYYLTYQPPVRWVERLRPKSGRWKYDKRVTAQVYSETPGEHPLTPRYSLVGKPYKGYQIWDTEQDRPYGQKFSRKDHAEAALQKLRKKAPKPKRKYEGRAGKPIAAYYTKSLKTAGAFHAMAEAGNHPLTTLKGVFPRVEYGAKKIREETGPYRVAGVGRKPPVGERGRFFPQTYTLITSGQVHFANQEFASPQKASEEAKLRTIKPSKKAPEQTIEEMIERLQAATPGYDKLKKAEVKVQQDVNKLKAYEYEVLEELGEGGWIYTTVLSAPGEKKGGVSITKEQAQLQQAWIRDKSGAIKTDDAGRRMWKHVGPKETIYVLRRKGGGTWRGTKAEMEAQAKRMSKGAVFGTKSQAQKLIDQAEDNREKMMMALQGKWQAAPDYILLAHGPGGSIEFTEDGGFVVDGPTGVVRIGDRATARQIFVDDSANRREKKRRAAAREIYAGEKKKLLTKIRKAERALDDAEEEGDTKEAARLRTLLAGDKKYYSTATVASIYAEKRAEWEDLAPERRTGKLQYPPASPYLTKASIGGAELDKVARLLGKRTRLTKGQKEALQERRLERGMSEAQTPLGLSPGVRTPSKGRMLLGRQMSAEAKRLREAGGKRTRVYLPEEEERPRKSRAKKQTETREEKIERLDAEIAMIKARMAARKKKNPRRPNGLPSAAITRKADLNPGEYYTIWLKMPSGGFVVERSYPGSYIRDAMWDDIKVYNRQNKRQYVVVGHGVDPNTGYRENFLGIGTATALAVRGGTWLVKSESGRKILTEAAVIGTAMIGDKLMKKGKVSPKVMNFIQARVEKELGRKPTKSEVQEALKHIDPNQDETLTAKEVTKALKRGRG